MDLYCVIESLVFTLKFEEKKFASDVLEFQSPICQKLSIFSI